ncbi:hypothetical protein ABEI05_05545 [Erwinia billingiae]|uniref:hypothetical protein n=1 Tax=Erwinia billingiae TaxID=182337 RepID=UPI003208B71C
MLITYVWLKSFDHFPALVPGFFCKKFSYTVSGAEERLVTEKHPNTDSPAQYGGIFLPVICKLEWYYYHYINDIHRYPHKTFLCTTNIQPVAKAGSFLPAIQLYPSRATYNR